ncbi:MAG: aminoacyl-tRNA hydrolase [Chloroflexi bacterium]|nr:aminoacyl-tRNA hydrolase [Chloroflexota bacterium]
MKLIVGLGNPGSGHANNRHNVGFICLAHLARTQGIRFDRKEAKARVGRGEIAGVEVMLAKPQTYMNLSGQSVGRLVGKFHISLSDLIVVHDDLDLPPGKIRIRPNGGSGGHKGIESIVSCLGSRDFLRLRVGIGRPATGIDDASEADIMSYVLGDFTAGEKQVIFTTAPLATEAIICLLTEGLAAAMNKYN